MSVTTIPERPVKKWRVIVFSAVAVLIALTFSGFFGGGLFLPSPWIDLQQPFQGYQPALHLWNSALWGMITVILLSGIVLALL